MTEDEHMDDARQLRYMRQEVFAHLNEAFNARDTFTWGPTRASWKTAVPDQVATWLLDSTDLRTRYGEASHEAVTTEVRLWQRTLP